jgi:hypothetical protein
MTVKKATGTGAGTPSSVQNVVVTLGGVPNYVEMDLATLAAGGADADAIIYAETWGEPITAYTNPGGTTTQATVEAIVAPYNGGDDNFSYRRFTFTAAGETKTYDLPRNFVFEAGKVYVFEFTLAGINVVPTDNNEANCFMVLPFTDLTFGVTHAYDGNTLRVDSTTYTGGFEAEVIWSDVEVIDGTPSVSSSGKETTVNVKTKIGASGNAVVKIYKSTDTDKTPVWSYHIWVVDYDGSATHTNNGFTFMDRNLGATEAGRTVAANGLFYQWGRKDPFPRAHAYGVQTSDINGTVANTIKNPGMFYSNPSSHGDWHYASRDNTLWGHGTTKSVYDPCPLGWRVPVNSNMSEATSPWYGFTANNCGTFSYGYNWGTNALYTALGYLSDDGSLSHTTSHGIYWSASPYNSGSNYVSIFEFNNTSKVNVHSILSRACGLSVRCVRE